MSKIISSFIAFVLMATPAFAQLSLTGEGTLKAKPDAAYLSIGVITESKTATTAIKQNARDMKTVINAIKNLGISEEDIQTSSFNVRPKYTYPQGRPATLAGFVVSHQLTILVRDLSNLGRAIDVGVTSGVNSAYNVRFTVLDFNKDQLRALAVANASKKASLYAKLAGFKLGKIKSLSESSYQGMQYGVGMQRLHDSTRATSFMPGEVQLKLTVNITWEIDN